VSVIALARKVGFSPPVVTILAKRPEKITWENEFELYGKWFSMILRCSLCSLTHNPISPILPLSKSEFLSTGVWSRNMDNRGTKNGKEVLDLKGLLPKQQLPCSEY